MRDTLAAWHRTRVSFDVETRTGDFSYGMSLILRDINLEIPCQSFLALISLSSGKTTLLCVMSKMLHLRQGTISLEGQPLRDLMHALWPGKWP